MEHIDNRRLSLLVCVLLAASTFAAYWPVLSNGFVLYDDADYVTENPNILKGLTSEGVIWAFKSAHAGNWHPLTTLSHMVDVQLFGLRPGGHHAISLLLHIVNGILLFWLLRRMTGTLWRSALVAGLFALHPLRVESVAWVAERKDVLSGLFFLLTLGAYARFVELSKDRNSGSGAMLSYSVALALFACGLMCKPMLVTLPLVLLLLDYWPLARRTTSPPSPSPTLLRLVLEKAPFFALSAASCCITYLVQKDAGAVGSFEALPLPFRLSNALISYVRYLGMMLWPGHLAVFYPLPKAWPAEYTLGAAALLLGLSAFVIIQGRRWPYLPVGWFWFLGTLVPVIGLVQVGRQALADRYTYLPSIGLLCLLVWGLFDLLQAQSRKRRAPNKPLPPLLSAARHLSAGVVLVTCASLTWRQATFWHDDITLFNRALEVTTDNAVAHNNLGAALLKADNLPTAQGHFAEAVRLWPNYPEALMNLGLCAGKQNKPQEASALLEQAIKTRPTAQAHYNLANFLTERGNLADAEAHYREAVRINPGLVEARYNLGNLLVRQGRREEAAQCYAQALELRRDYVEVQLSLGSLLMGLQRPDEAIPQFRAAVQAAPSNPDAHFNLAAALALKGNVAEAQAHYLETCRLRPDDTEARTNLGLLLMSQGKPTEALAQFDLLLRVRPDPQAHYLSALIMDSQGRTAEASAHYREAIRLTPKVPAYLNDFAWLLATTDDDRIRSGAEAVRLAQEACQISEGKEPRFWGTLDAAYAETGRFDEAISTATRTRDMALAVGQKEVADAATARLALYREHKPYRQPRNSPATDTQKKEP